MEIKLLSDFFKPYTDAIKRALEIGKKRNNELSDSQLIVELEKDKEVIKAAFDNDLIDHQEYKLQLDVVKGQINELKKKKQDYADAIIYDSEGNILLLRRAISDDFCPDQWSLPGGKIENGEEPSDAVKREVAEETNLTITSTSLILEKQVDKGGCIYYFLCTVNGDFNIILDTEEHIEYSFLSKEQRHSLNLIFDLNDVLDDIEDVTLSKYLLFPELGSDETKYSSIIEEIAKTPLPRKDIIMLELFSKGEIDEDSYIDYIEKSYKDPSHGGKLTKITGKDKTGKNQTKWVNKTELKKLANHAKNTPKKDLEETVKNHPHPKVRAAAHTELSRREKEEHINEEPKDDYESHPYHGKEVKFDPETGLAQDEEGNSIDIKKLHEYHELRVNTIVSKMHTMDGDRKKAEVSYKRTKNKLLKEFYKKVERTHFSESKDVPQAYKSSILKLERMGLKEEDVDKEKLNKILIKKFAR